MVFLGFTNSYGVKICKKYDIDISVVVLRITIIQNKIKGIKANKTWKIFESGNVSPISFPSTMDQTLILFPAAATTKETFLYEKVL